MTQFVVGSKYTLNEITTVLHGELLSCLPQSNNKIVCGRFRPAPMNPNAPYEILIGDFPKVRRKVAALVAQGGAIPVFLKEGSNRWHFHGRMRVARYATDPAMVRTAKGVRKRDKIVGVLYLCDAP